MVIQVIQQIRFLVVPPTMDSRLRNHWSAVMRGRLEEVQLGSSLEARYEPNLLRCSHGVDWGGLSQCTTMAGVQVERSILFSRKEVKVG